MSKNISQKFYSWSDPKLLVSFEQQLIMGHTQGAARVRDNVFWMHWTESPHGIPTVRSIFFFLPSHLLLLMWSDSLLCISCKTQFNFAFMKKARLDHTLSREVYRVPHPNVPILRSMDRHIPQRPSDLLKIVSKIIAPPLWKCMVMYAAAYEKDTKSLMDFY